MMKHINPSKINGAIVAPASKSMTLRAIAAATLAKGKSQIKTPSYCKDALGALRCAHSLGAKISSSKNHNLFISGSGKIRSTTLNCGESGLCVRMFSPICATYGTRFTLVGEGSLKARPISMIEKPLVALGASCKTKKGYLPATIKGPIKGGKIVVDGSESSQFLTGLLMALPLCRENSSVHVRNLASKPYIQMTLSLLSDFGVKIRASKDLSHFEIPGKQKYRHISYSVEGDWSGAAFPLVAGAVCGRVTVSGLSKKSFQADAAIIGALKKCGAKVTQKSDSTTVQKARLRAFKFNAHDCPDLFPPLAVLACNCSGTSKIQGVKRLSGKESDRASALKIELGKLGAKIRISGDVMEITGAPIIGGTIDSRNDHRIAMAGAIAALTSKKGVRIINPECVSKSYPEFFHDLRKLQVHGKS